MLVSDCLVVLGQPLATVGDFPAAFAAVYVLGAIAAFGIGFHALKKAREVNAENFEDLSPDPQDSDNEVS